MQILPSYFIIFIIISISNIFGFIRYMYIKHDILFIIALFLLLLILKVTCLYDYFSIMTMLFVLCIVYISKYINNNIMYVSTSIISILIETWFLKYYYMFNAWTVSMIIIKNILCFLALKNETENTKYVYIPIIATLIIQMLNSYLYNFAPIITTICDWRQSFVLLSIAYVSYLGILNILKRNMNIIILLCVINGFIGIFSNKYIILILPLIIQPLIRKINELFHNKIQLLTVINNLLIGQHGSLLYLLISIICCILYYSCL